MATTKELIKTRFDELMKEKTAITDQSLPFRSKRDGVLAKIRKLQEEENGYIAEYKKIETPLAAIDQELSTLALALGGLRLSKGTGE